jgi:hypothetical protein
MSETKALTFKINAEDDGLGRFSGTASTYGNVDQAGDVMIKGCFAKSIAQKGTHFPLLWSHNMDEVIGSFDVKSLEESLSIEGKFNMGVQRGKEGYALLKAGDIQGLSIGFSIKDCDWDSEGHRLIKEADLWEVSLVAFPCNLEASAEAKNMIMNEKKSYKDLSEEEREKLKQLIKDALADMEEPEEDEETEKDETESEEDESTEEDEAKAIEQMAMELKGLRKELST